jgi:hypothetical protein
MFKAGAFFVSAIFLFLSITIQMLRSAVFIFFCVLAGAPALAQKQLVLLKREKVLLRLEPGDEFIFKLKNDKRIRRSYVNNLFDDAVKIQHDTIKFSQIDKVYFKRTSRINIIGGALVFAGTALFLIDQLNYSVIQGHEASLDGSVTRSSIVGVVIGLPMLLWKKKSQRLSYRYRLFTAKKGSPFFKPDPKGYASPFIDQ